MELLVKDVAAVTGPLTAMEAQVKGLASRVNDVSTYYSARRAETAKLGTELASLEAAMIKIGAEATKLRARVIHPFSRNTRSAGRETKIVHPNARIVAVVIYILTHIAATGPRYCQLVMSQTELLKLLVQQASNKDCEVRLALCRLLYNLTTKDNGADSQACAQRAAELRRLGFSSKIETLMKQDRDLNVRENARMAAWLIDNPAS